MESFLGVPGRRAAVGVLAGECCCVTWEQGGGGGSSEGRWMVGQGRDWGGNVWPLG